MRAIITTIVLFFFLVSAYAQKPKGHYMNAKIVNGDTIIIIDPIYIFPARKFSSRGEERKYLKLVYNLKRVYPYSVLARMKFIEMQDELLRCKTENQKKAFARKYEKAILDQYGDELKELTITQGRLLLKLIDRELGKTSFTLLKEYRGSFNAMFWQTLARFFGTNLKDEYDPEGEDKLIEEIVTKIECGVL